MARHETDRENLMLEATALIRRAEWSIPSHSDPIVAGFKRSGGWSLYFGPDPVYQYDADGRLRRAFVDGQIWRTQGTTLAGLRRERRKTESDLLRHDLSELELSEFLRNACRDLEALHTALVHGTAQLLRQVPESSDVTVELTAALRTALDNGIRLAPAIPGKK